LELRTNAAKLCQISSTLPSSLDYLRCNDGIDEFSIGSAGQSFHLFTDWPVVASCGWDTWSL
jgi:hypothetical protein